MQGVEYYIPEPNYYHANTQPKQHQRQQNQNVYLPVHMKKRRLMVAKEKEPNSQSKYLSDSDSSDDTEINPRLKTLVEERQYNTGCQLKPFEPSF